MLAGGYLGAVGVFAAVRGSAGLPRPQALAATPAALASGKLWLLVTSAFVVSGPPPLELAAVARIVHDPDFGISAVWMGVLGALLGGSVGSAMRAPVRCREQDLREHLLVAVCLIAAVTGLVFFPPLPGAEHTLAFALGAAVSLRPWRRPA